MKSPQDVRCRRPCRAFSTLEILIAVVLLILAVLPMLDLLIGAGRQSRQTADYSSSLSLITKVSEELRLAGWENPNLADSLRRDLDGGRASSVTDGHSPFFRTIEDDEAPYGFLDEGRDSPLDQTYETLRAPLKTHSIGFSSCYRSLPTTGRLLEIQVGLSWKGHQNRLLEMSLPVCVADLAVRPQLPKAIVDRTVADGLIVGFLYPDRIGRTLTQVVSEAGGRLDLVRALGDCLVVPRILAVAVASKADQIASLRSKVSGADPSLDRARAALALALIFEEQAARYLDAMVALSTPLELLASDWTSNALGRQIPSSTLISSLSQVRDLDVGFCRCTVDTLAAYRQAHNQPLGPSLSARVRTRTLVRMVDVLRTSVVALKWPDLDYLRSTIKGFQRQQMGCNPNFVAWAESELESCRDRDTLVASSAPWLPTAVERFESALQAVIKKVQTPY